MTSGPSSNRSGPSAPQPDWEAIGRAMAGESSPAEEAAVRAWLDAHPDERALVDALHSLPTGIAADVDVEAALAALHRRMEADAADSRPAHAASRWRVAVATTFLAAAAVLMLVVTMRRSSQQPAAAAVRSYATAVGQRDSLALADGSHVVLGPDSRLDVPANFGRAGAASRTVTLRGDALFIVHHDPAMPFAVQVGRALVQDIGTTFAVESDVGAETRVSVVAGSVRLRGTTVGADTGVTLAAGDRGTVDLTGRAHAERHAPVADDVAWATGRLSFRDAPVTEVARELRRWYGVLLEVGDSSLAARHITTSFDSRQPVDDVLKRIGLALGATVERHGDSATITTTRGSSGIR